MSDDDILMKGGDEDDIRKYAEQNGASPTDDIQKIAEKWAVAIALQSMPNKHTYRKAIKSALTEAVAPWKEKHEAMTKCADELAIALLKAKSMNHSDELYPWKDCSCATCKALTTYEQLTKK